MNMNSSKVDIWVDGACSGNPGPGGWAVLIVWPEGHWEGSPEVEFSGSASMTTNNQMELVAVAEALWAIPVGSVVTINTDSKNVIGWLYGWNTLTNCPDNTKRWKRKDEKIASLCVGIDAAIESRELQVSFEWVKGHTGDKRNERVNELAQGKIKR